MLAATFQMQSKGILQKILSRACSSYFWGGILLGIWEISEGCLRAFVALQLACVFRSHIYIPGISKGEEMSIIHALCIITCLSHVVDSLQGMKIAVLPPFALQLQCH